MVAGAAATSGRFSVPPPSAGTPPSPSTERPPLTLTLVGAITSLSPILFSRYERSAAPGIGDVGGDDDDEDGDGDGDDDDG